MDLRQLVSSRSQVERAKKLAMRGLLNYQPFTFADDLACGSGMSIVQGHRKNPPSIWCPNVTTQDAGPDYIESAVVKPEDKDEFFSDNAQLARCYDGMVDQIITKLGGVKGLSMMEAGCNAGYFPLSFARAGAARTVGYDRVDYSGAFALLNEICRTKAQFKLWSYNGELEADEKFDLVMSVAVLVHLSDPLHHLAWLGSAAKKALFVFTPCHTDDDYSIRYHTVNRYYEDRFPYCFDVTTVSRKLLYLAFEKMGFSDVVEVTTEPMPPKWSGVHLGLLGLRTGAHEGAKRQVIR
jgi:SAM-dependent methyltransferase